MTLDMKATVRLVELAAKPAVFEQDGAGGFAYKVVEQDGRFVVLVLRDGETPRISRYCKTREHAKREVENLSTLSRALESKMGKRS